MDDKKFDKYVHGTDFLSIHIVDAMGKMYVEVDVINFCLENGHLDSAYLLTLQKCAVYPS